jgi:hypothetical protein
VRAQGFDKAIGTATPGVGYQDLARLFDAAKADVLEATPSTSRAGEKTPAPGVFHPAQKPIIQSRRAEPRGSAGPGEQ